MVDQKQRLRGSVPKSFLDDLLGRVDLVQLIGHHVVLRKEGAEFKGLCPFHSEKSPSFTVNESKGFYHCFGCGAHGDAIAFLTDHLGLPFREAVEELAGTVGMVVPDGGAAPASVSPRGATSLPARRPEKRKSVWQAVTPVPPHAPAPSFRHYERGQPAVVWAYRRGDDLLGYVCRFNTSDGGKEILPYTWCVDISDDRGLSQWHFKQWDEPRPLFLAASALRGLPVRLVEGEKCAQAAHDMLGDQFDFVSWPGGSKAVDKVDWSWLAGLDVTAWADADAKRVRLSKAEEAAGVDPLSKPFLPLEKQGGYMAMAAILTRLKTEHGCTVRLCPMQDPAVQTVPDGWDVADAIAEGWTAEQVQAHFDAAQPFVPRDGAMAEDIGHARAKSAPAPATAGAGLGFDPLAWRVHLICNNKGEIRPVRENLVLALDGIPSQGISPAEGALGTIAYNEFTNDVMKPRATPWGTPDGVWTEVDELKMGEWLVRQHRLPSMPRSTLEEAVRMVAYNRRYHPVRDYLTGLKWDGVKRLHTWLARCCLVDDEWDIANDPLHAYLARVGTWFLQGMCARVMQPGVKFDYMLILEGAQGIRKSTLFRVLAGDWFADTGLNLGDKDSYQQLQGRWLYEFSELDSFGKTETTKVKAFIASSADYFRASFDRRAREYPRQLCFGGTTNEHHYLTDPTGNRRMWVVRVTRDVIDIDWLVANRDQLFAEAMQRFADGRRMYPTPEEEREFFSPQQGEREVENAIQSAITKYLYNDAGDGVLVNEISLVDLLGKIGIGIEKLGPGRFHEKQAASALRRLGWSEGRSSAPGRPRVYRRPQEDASASETSRGDINNDQDGKDDCPF